MSFLARLQLSRGRLRSAFRVASVPFAIYFLGLLGIALFDLFAARSLSVSQAASWAYLKSSIFTAAGFCIFGLDQVLVRRPDAFRTLGPLVLIQIALIAIPVSWGIAARSHSSFSVWEMASLLFFTTALVAFSAMFRGAKQFAQGQLALNGWKFFFLLFGAGTFYLTGTISLYDSLLGSILVALLIGLAGERATRRTAAFYARSKPMPVREAYKEGSYFFLFSATLAFSVNGEQLVLGWLGDEHGAAALLAHFSVFTPMLIFLNGFLGYLVQPYMRDMKQLSVATAQRLFLLIVSGSLLLLILSLGVGSLAFTVLFDGKYALDPVLTGLVLGVGFLRSIYLFPSSLLGMRGSRGELTAFLGLQILGLIGFAFVIVLSQRWSPLGGAAVVLAASVLNWTLRAGGGSYLAFRMLRHQVAS